MHIMESPYLTNSHCEVCILRTEYSEQKYWAPEQWEHIFRNHVQTCVLVWFNSIPVSLSNMCAIHPKGFTRIIRKAIGNKPNRTASHRSLTDAANTVYLPHKANISSPLMPRRLSLRSCGAYANHYSANSNASILANNPQIGSFDPLYFAFCTTVDQKMNTEHTTA